MATQLQIRRGTSSQVAAFTGAEGEIVVNTTNDSVHVNDGSTAGGFELARVDGSNWAITNAISTTANISFGDNDKAIFGAGSDLQIYHDGSNSYIKDLGTGVLYIQGSSQVNIGGANGTIGVQFVEGANITLRHNNVPVLSTTSTGIDVTGTVTADGLTVSTVGSIGTGSGGLFIGSSPQTSGISFFGTALYPNAGSSISATDGANDLGAPTARWKDLYLSGGAYIGGTGAANKLDDYDEGSWEPQVFYQNATDQAGATNTFQSGKYVKIGNIVILSFRLDFTAPSSPANDNIGVKNFPFAGTNNHYNASGTVITSTTQTALIIGPVLSGSTQAIIQRSDNSGNYGDEFGTGTGKYIRGTITYLTN